jgi:hypothetical protein
LLVRAAQQEAVIMNNPLRQYFLYTPLGLILGIALALILFVAGGYILFSDVTASAGVRPTGIARPLLIGGIVCVTLSLAYERRRYTMARQPPIMPQQLVTMLKNGYSLPIPDGALPPRNVSPEDLRETERQARQLALLPWGQKPQEPEVKISV